MNSTLLHSFLATAMVATAVPSFCQNQAPPMLNVVRYQVKLDRLQEFEDVEKQIAGSYTKAATDQFRVVYRENVGNATVFWVLTPLSKLAERDGENPYNKMATEQERLTRTARLSQDLEGVQTSIERTLPDLGITTPSVSFPPAWVQRVRVGVRPGKVDEFVNVIKTELVPALKKSGTKLFIARRTVFGGNIDDFTFGVGFEKWAELDSTPPLGKVMGEEAFRKMMEKLNEITTGREDSILRYQPDLSYYPGSPSR